jgi:hypothetical protein
MNEYTAEIWTSQPILNGISSFREIIVVSAPNAREALVLAQQEALQREDELTSAQIRELRRV